MASFYVGKSGKSGWRLLEQIYDSEKKKYNQITVKKEAYVSLGFNPEWSTEKAKERVRQLNAANSEERKDSHKAVGAANRVAKLNKLSSIYAPVELCEQFIRKLQSDSFGSERHRKRLVYHFNYIQKLVKDLKLEAHTFHENKMAIYHYFQNDCVSLDSVGTILRIMNRWARFVCKERKQYFEEIEPPRGQVRVALEEAYIDSEDFRGESDPLTPEILEKARLKLKPDQYNWLYLTIWLGLRPQETTGLHNPKTYKLTSEKDTPVIEVYMPKLTSLSKDKRWKSIPLIVTEQHKCLEIIKSGEFKAPTLKTMQDVFGAKRYKSIKGSKKASGTVISLYGGRKGFIDLMMDRKQVLEDISSWLGHQTIEITWRKYRNKKRVSFTRVG